MQWTGCVLMVQTHRLLGLICVALLALLAAACGGASSSALFGELSFGRGPSADGGYALSARELSLSHLQVKGSHNSYHKAPRIPLSRTWRYTHAPIAVQLKTQGVRQLELDVRYDDGQLVVGHLPVIDGRSTCRTLRDCLTELKTWSKEHPGHLPVFVFIEPKEDLAPSQLDGRVDTLDGTITRVFSRENLLTPEDVVGHYPSLKEAVRARGWPSLAASRGKVAFVLFGSKRHVRAYAAGRPKLEGRVMFAAGPEELPSTAVLSYDNPLEDAAAIERAVREGLLVRTRADANLKRDHRRRDVALASGAHFIGSDFVDPRHGWVELGEDAPFRCNPVSAPRACGRTNLAELENPFGNNLARR